MKEWVWILLYILTFIVFFFLGIVQRLKFPRWFKKDPRKVQWSDAIGKVYTDVSYDIGEKNKFDLFLPADSAKETYGLVVYLHAGGFTQGDKSEDAPLLQYYCSKGYVATGINYTLRTQSNTASVYDMSMEIKRAIPIVIEKAAQHGYKIDRMAVAGGSAGHGLAMIYAYRDAAEAPVPLKCVFGAVGPACFEPKVWYGLGADAAAAGAFLSTLCGQTITVDMMKSEEYKEIIKPISAYAWITPHSVPSLCAYGTYDKLVPFGQAEVLRKALEDNHVPHDFIVCPRSGHGLQNDHKEANRYADLIDEYLDKYLG